MKTQQVVNIFCKDCGKDLSDTDANYAKYKFGYHCCMDCSPINKYNKNDIGEKINTKEQQDFLDNNSIEDILF